MADEEQQVVEEVPEEVEEEAAEEEEEEEEEDLVDPHDTMKEECATSKDCRGLKDILDTCTDRVNSKSATTETCFEELIDLIQCVDHCVDHRGLLQILK